MCLSIFFVLPYSFSALQIGECSPTALKVPKPTDCGRSRQISYMYRGVTTLPGSQMLGNRRIRHVGSQHLNPLFPWKLTTARRGAYSTLPIENTCIRAFLWGVGRNSCLRSMGIFGVHSVYSLISKIP